MRYHKPKPVKKTALGVKKVTVSLPPELVADLDLISGSLGLSRSAFLSSMLSQSLPPIKATVASLQGAMETAKSESAEDPDGALQRYNAHSKDAINDFIKNLLSGGQDDLFNHK